MGYNVLFDEMNLMKDTIEKTSVIHIRLRLMMWYDIISEQREKPDMKLEIR